jgi:hypothetical protein
MNKTRVVNRHKEDYDIYIGRPSIWGNPFREGKDGNRGQVIEMYKIYLLNSPHLLQRLCELKGKRLGCTCFPKLCHGDVLVELIQQFCLEKFLGD